MLEKNNRYRLLKAFLNSPTESFRLRELGRIARISPPSVMQYLKEFERREIIRRYENRGIPFYKAERENENFIFYKKLSVLYELHVSGLVGFLWEKLAPEAIILYGSYAKGESTEGSDIDIFVIGKERPLKIKEFEKKLGKEVHLMFNPEIQKIPKELKNNLINGIVLKGYFRAFE